MAAHAALESGLDPVIVVFGYDAEAVEKGLAALPVQLVFDPDFESGKSTSVRKAIEALPARTGAAFFMVADQPPTAASVIRDLVKAHRRTLAPACVPVFDGQNGPPVLFDRALFGELRELRGDAGVQALLEKHGTAVVSVPANRKHSPAARVNNLIPDSGF